MNLENLFAPSDVGANSPHAIVQAFHLVNTHDLTALLAPLPRATGSTDELLAAYRLFQDEMEIRIECKRGFAAILFPRERDLELLTSDFGPLPRTWETTCGGCKVVKWFLVPNGADLQFGEKINGTNAKLLRSVAVPGSRKRLTPDTLADASEPRHEWIKGREPWSIPIGELPADWVASLPHNGARSLSAVPSRRADPCSNPRSPRFTG